MLVAVFGIAIAANAQSDQCSITNGNGGYIKAYVSSESMTSDPPYIYITTEPSKEQPEAGSVICKITYERESDGQRETITRNLNFGKKSSTSNSVKLDSKARRIVSIEIYGAECKSVNRNNY